MNLAKSLMKRPIILASLGGAVVLALAWWFAWMAPIGGKLASVRATEASDQLIRSGLLVRLGALERDAKQVKSAGSALQRYSQALPSTPDAPGLVVQVYDLAQRDNVKLESITDNSVDPSSAGYATMPVTMTVSGGHDAVVSFVSGLYALPRLLTVQSLSLSGTGDLNSSGSQSYTASISATAYTLDTPTGAANGPTTAPSAGG